MTDEQNHILEHVADIISAYVANNAIEAGQLPTLIGKVHASLTRLGQAAAPAEELVPAVAVKKSVHADHIVCLEDGRGFKSLKLHLGTAHGMTPDEYKAKWNLPRDYPMVAPDYAAQRSELAFASGLGRKPATVKAKARGGKNRG